VQEALLIRPQLRTQACELFAGLPFGKSCLAVCELLLSCFPAGYGSASGGRGSRGKS